MIRLDGVTVRAGGFTLADVSLEVPSGGYALLIGPTGSGKTTLLETVAGHQAPERGRVWLHGEDVTDRPPERRGVGFVYQDHLLFPHLTVAENIGYGLGARASGGGARVAELAETLGITALLPRSTARLSGGERQRVALARALAPKPQVLLLDEPFASLDPTTRASLRRALLALQRIEQVTILQVSHDFDEALRLGDLVAVLAEGRILQQGTPEAVFRRPNSAFVAQFTGAGNVLAGEVRQAGATEGDGRFMARFTAGPIELDVVADRVGACHAVIRPEDLLVSRDPLAAARNHLRAVVERVERIGPVAYIYCDAGRPLVATVTTAGADAMALAPGATVSVTIKATAVLLV
ncbi:MAG TPA: ABC transporter ATP-binding protein [Gemmatimonadales bacterium]|nr:ABC transporter ATP-binding protein [Gemmatimonadales bacterium]